MRRLVVTMILQVKLMVVLLFVLGLQAVRHARIMRRCGLEQFCCSNPVTTSDSGESSPRLWVTNQYSLSPTRRSNMHANDKGRMNGYKGNDNREQNDQRKDTGGTNFTYGDSHLPRLCHEGPSSPVPEHPKKTITQQRENLLLRVGLNNCNLPIRKFSDFRDCGLESVTLSIGNTKVFGSELLSHAGTDGCVKNLEKEHKNEEDEEFSEKTSEINDSIKSKN